MHHLVIELVLHQFVDQASEVAMQALVAGNQLVRERQTGHQSTLLQPVDGTEAAAEENTYTSRQTQYFSARSPRKAREGLNRPSKNGSFILTHS